MAFDFKLPDLGENVDSGDIVNILVKEGDQIEPEQNVFEIETGKAVVELPCPTGGRVTKIHVKKGSKVKVGESLLSVEPAGASNAKAASKLAAGSDAKKTEPAPAAKRESSKPQPEAAKPQVEEKPVAPSSAPAGMPHPGKTPPAGPATRRLARELGVDLAEVNGTGPGGRITEEDVKAAVRETVTAKPTPAPAIRAVPLPDGVDEQDSWGRVRKQKLSAIRRSIAVNMARAASTIPHVTNFDDADITELERIRKGGLSDYAGSNIKLTMMSFVLKAVAQSLRLHPLINASIDMENEEVIYKEYVNLGVAVDTERGLVVPVIRNVDRLSIPAIAQQLTAAAEKARSGKFSLDELRGSTFTISNLGAVGGTYSTPIINAPDVAILLVGRSRKLPVVIDDKTEIRLMMPLSLSYDHRLVDGAAAARFLNEVIDYLHVPGRLLLAP